MLFLTYVYFRDLLTNSVTLSMFCFSFFLPMNVCVIKKSTACLGPALLRSNSCFIFSSYDISPNTVTTLVRHVHLHPNQEPIFQLQHMICNTWFNTWYVMNKYISCFTLTRLPTWMQQMKENSKCSRTPSSRLFQAATKGVKPRRKKLFFFCLYDAFSFTRYYRLSSFPKAKITYFIGNLF